MSKFSKKYCFEQFKKQIKCKILSRNRNCEVSSLWRPYELENLRISWKLKLLFIANKFLCYNNRLRGSISNFPKQYETSATFFKKNFKSKMWNIAYFLLKIKSSNSKTFQNKMKIKPSIQINVFFLAKNNWRVKFLNLFLDFFQKVMPF